MWHEASERLQRARHAMPPLQVVAAAIENVGDATRIVVARAVSGFEASEVQAAAVGGLLRLKTGQHNQG